MNRDKIKIFYNLFRIHVCFYSYKNNLEYFLKRITRSKTLLTYFSVILAQYSVSSFYRGASKVILNDSPFDYFHETPTLSAESGKLIFHTYQIGCAFGGDITNFLQDFDLPIP